MVSRAVLLIGLRDGRVKVVCRWECIQTPGEVSLEIGFFAKCQLFFLNSTPLLTLFLPFLAALCPTAAVEIYTSGALEAVNGTDVRLKCTFSSFAPVGDALTVTWNFRP